MAPPVDLLQHEHLSVRTVIALSQPQWRDSLRCPRGIAGQTWRSDDGRDSQS